MTDDDITWEAPGPGSWERDRSHAPPAGTPVFRRVMETAITTAYRGVFLDYGAPLETIEVRMVRGGMYRRVVPLIGGDRGDRPPPRPVLWAASRLHPKLRARNKRAVQLFDEGIHLEPLDHWFRAERDEWIVANQAIQGEDLGGMDDGQLADHLERVGDHLMAGNLRHHVLHGTDMGPIGDLLAHAQRWGADLPAIMQLLQGASPATREAGRLGADIAEALRDEGTDPATVTSVEQIRAAGPRSAAALDAYLALYEWRVVSSYDIEGLTVGEMPSIIVAVVRAGADWVEPDDSEIEQLTSDLRSTLAPEHREAFTERLEEARLAYGLRDDNGPLTAEWPIGLTRRVYIEAGRRLVAHGRVSAATRVFELDIDELAAVLRGAETPSRDALDERAAHRAWEATLDPPSLLGDPPGQIDPSALPAGLRRLTESVLACVAMLEKVDGGAPLEGMGIGDTAYTGRARLAAKPEDVLATFEPGDVLVAAWTAPTYNAVIASAGAMVVEEGGLLCHAAVIARELGVPAVIGATGALDLIAEGAMVTVDPAAGRVTVG